MGKGIGDVGMMEFLHMGGYAGYVWSSYGIVLLVLSINLIFSQRRHKALLRRLKKIHNLSENNES